MMIGRRLELDIFGESHAPSIGMRLKGLPREEQIDWAAVQRFVDRRSASRNRYSTARHEPDVVEIVRDTRRQTRRADGVVEAIIRNVDTRSVDYEKTIPRPGHADWPNWVRTGHIPSGGGANSGRMTAAMCIAGGICLGCLERRGISVRAKLVRCGDVARSAAEGDSVGGIVECTVKGVPVGTGGAMFDGLESAISEVVFGIPGVKGIEFGNGFACADLKGSENNDAFCMRGGRVATLTNRHGGILGGMASGMPIVFRVAFKPTPSIFKPQRSVDLATGRAVTLTIRGRHDPCIAIRAVPVVEAMAAFAILDAVLSDGCGDDVTTARPCVLGPRRRRFPNVVIDANVARLYPELAKDALLVLPSGERYKTIRTVERIWSAFARAGIGRSDTVTAIGGGVTNDLVGFAAATWMRGIAWISIPTTLLSMVDASFGGKTGFDLPAGKNMAGAFHAPIEIVIDSRFLKTLPPRELANGRAEMIKHEIIGALTSRTASGRPPTTAEILANREVKRRIVEADPFERLGLRAKLNLGHTVGHAVERRSGYRFSHGEGVAIGCVEEAHLAERLGLAPAGWADEIAGRFARAGLPTALPEGMTFDSLRSIMKHDKKNADGHLVFALPCGWGDVRIVKL